MKEDREREETEKTEEKRKSIRESMCGYPLLLIADSAANLVFSH